jgi:hypothetical protein
MHGGFENETPNIPTNTIMKLELNALLKGTPNLTVKLEQAIGAQKKRAATSPSASTTSVDVTSD